VSAPQCQCRSVYCPHCGRRRTGRTDPLRSGGFIDTYGIMGPAFVIFLIVAVTGFWPAMVWHGYGGPSGTSWRWDIHSTIAEAVYWGCIAFVVFLCWLGSRVPANRPPRGRLMVEATVAGAPEVAEGLDDGGAAQGPAGRSAG
jgi:hypothetical protein